jgi:PhoPQ-activated pathogenicity-related protein
MTAESELFHYVERADETFAWQHLETREQSGVTVTRLHLTSQLWQGIPWLHTVELFVPAQIRDPGLALLYVATPGGMGQTEIGTALAHHTGVVCVFLSDIPNQPLFGDLIEDALIAHTFVQYLDTGDTTWPLLFPMVKSVVRAMDAVHAYGAQHDTFTAERFVVSGASKRGWTTWLTAAVDPRVVGIAPMVYDNLNIPAQMPHQVEVFEGYSEQIGDYTRADLPQRMQTPGGMHLARMVDPYTYLDHLSMPKLIINGANDPYWATDAINLYWDDLPGIKHILDIPNVGHSLNDPQRLFSTIAVFLRGIAEQRGLPRLDWSFAAEDRAVTLNIATDEPAVAARVWVAYAPGRDFRNAPWTAIAMFEEEATSPQTGLYSATIARPDHGGHMALYGEVEFRRDGDNYTLSTQVHIAAGT